MKDNYTQDFLIRLRENLNLKKQRDVFEAVLGETVWEILPADITAANLSKINSFKVCSGSFAPSGCAQIILKAVKSSKDRSGPTKFNCCSGMNGFCLPLKQGNQLYGFIIVCGFSKNITDRLMAIFIAFTETIMREVQKEMELTKLYDTIRPRAIALSTIHTVHRLISSTLNLDELMPRIARLCLQVMRAKICHIFMFEKNKKRLVLKSAIKSDKEIKKAKSYMKLTGILGRVVRTGASVLKTKQLLVPLINEDVIGVIGVRDKLGDKPFSEFDKEILTTFAEQAVIAIRNAQLYKEQEKLTLGSIKSLATILDSRPQYLQLHSAAFVRLAVETAKELQMPMEDMRVLKYASFLHDAGKVAIPYEILKKPKKLTGKEYDIVKRYPAKAVEIVKPIELLKPVIPIILYHHEKFDGTGYPEKLKGEKIPLGSRIMAVVDAFIAMVTKQPYRECISVQEALAEIKRYSATQFDPKVVEAFIHVISKTNVQALLKVKTSFGF